MLSDWASTLSTVGWFLGIGVASVVVAAYYFQDGLLYVPTLPGLPRDVMVTPFAFGWKSDLAAYEQVWVREPVDDLKLQAWFFKSHRDAGVARTRPTVLFLHSNAGNLSHRIPNIRELVETCHFNVFILSYRGYGRSDGTPSEEGLKRDAAAALRYLATAGRADVDPNRIVVLGRSLGGAVGIWLAANFPEWCAALLVENAFTSVPDMVDVVLPALKRVKWLSRNTWDNVKEIERVTVPILFLSSSKDELVPPAHMRALHAAAVNSPQRRFVPFADAQHMNCVPEADHQILTSAGFLLLRDVERRVVRDAATGRVVDWRGLRVASFDAAAQQLVYKTPRALVVSRGRQSLVELTAHKAQARVSIVATRGHRLYVRSRDGRAFEKRAAGDVARDVGAPVHFLAAPRNGVAGGRKADAHVMAQLRLDAQQFAALLSVHGRAQTIADWMWRLSPQALQHWAAGLRSGARVADAALRDSVVRLLLHAGVSASCSASGRVEWHADSEPTLRDVREFDCDGRTWCFDMSTDGTADDGFVVVRRVDESGAAWRATIQGNCFQQPHYYECVMDFCTDVLHVPRVGSTAKRPAATVAAQS
jgi:abhydrolase domain-containing protein 13